MRAVAGGRGRGGPPVVVANGVESEPASGKDAILLSHSPHLVLDGIAAAAAAVGAGEAYLCVDDSRPQQAGPLRRPSRTARTRGWPRCRSAGGPAHRYVASEESALVNFLNGGSALPVFVPPRPFARGVGGRRRWSTTWRRWRTSP